MEVRKWMSLQPVFQVRQRGKIQKRDTQFFKLLHRQRADVCLHCFVQRAKTALQLAASIILALPIRIPFLIPGRSNGVTYSIFCSSPYAVILSSNSVSRSSGSHNTQSTNRNSPMTICLLNPRSYNFLAGATFRSNLLRSSLRVSSAARCACMTTAKGLSLRSNSANRSR